MLSSTALILSYSKQVLNDNNFMLSYTSLLLSYTELILFDNNYIFLYIGRYRLVLNEKAREIDNNEQH